MIPAHYDTDPFPFPGGTILAASINGTGLFISILTARHYYRLNRTTMTYTRTNR